MKTMTLEPCTAFHACSFTKPVQTNGVPTRFTNRKKSARRDLQDTIVLEVHGGHKVYAVFYNALVQPWQPTVLEAEGCHLVRTNELPLLKSVAKGIPTYDVHMSGELYFLCRNLRKPVASQ